MEDGQSIQNSNELSLDLVDWMPHYILSRASIGQIMYSFSRVGEARPKNIYEYTLYEKLKKITKKLLNEYNKILEFENEFERQVKFFNLIGNMPFNVSVFDEIHGNIKLKYPKIGQLIKAANQRIDFILEREIPDLYQNNENLLKAFEKMRNELEIFGEALNIYEEKFVKAINDAHIAQQNTN